MFKIIRESFKITNNYIVIATPLILFSLISSLYLIFAGQSSVTALTFSVILFLLMLAAFLSGWFYMIMKGVKDPAGNNSLLPEFMSGVGEYFIPIIGFLFNIFVISVILIIGSFLIGKKLIGPTGISSSEMLAAMTSIETMKNFAASLSSEQLLKINEWNILLIATMVINYFIFMFYAPAMFFKRKNPFIALLLSFKDLFSAKIFKNFGLFFLIFTSYMLLSALNTLYGANIIMHFIFTLVNFYYVTYVAVLVFNYYYSNYAKIGSAIDKTV